MAALIPVNININYDEDKGKKKNTLIRCMDYSIL